MMVVDRDQGKGPTFSPALSDALEMFNRTTERLRESHERLRQKVGDLQRELEEKNVQLRRKNRLAVLGEMSACLAHEIRNPLGSIELFASLLGKECGDDAGKRELVAKIHGGVQRLNRLVQDMLAFAGRAEPVIAPFALEAAIDRALTYGTDRIQEKGIQVVKRYEAGGCVVLGDESMMERVFLNIIANAAQAMGREGTLTIRTTREKGAIVAAFSDTGEGLSREAAEKLFTPFYTSKKSGTGLGLTIAHQIVESHGGSLTAKNNEGVGATFTVSLPMEGSESGADTRG